MSDRVATRWVQISRKRRKTPLIFFHLGVFSSDLAVSSSIFVGAEREENLIRNLNDPDKGELSTFSYYCNCSGKDGRTDRSRARSDEKPVFVGAKVREFVLEWSRPLKSEFSTVPLPSHCHDKITMSLSFVFHSILMVFCLSFFSDFPFLLTSSWKTWRWKRFRSTGHCLFHEFGSVLSTIDAKLSAKTLFAEPLWYVQWDYKNSINFTIENYSSRTFEKQWSFISPTSRWNSGIVARKAHFNPTLTLTGTEILSVTLPRP